MRRLGGNYSSINCTSAGGRRGLLSSGRHLDNRQVTTCCKPRAGPGIGWVRAGHRRKLPPRTRRWVTRKHEQSSNIQSIFPYSSIGNCIDTEAEDLIHSGQSWLFIFLAVAQVQYISGVIINGPVMSLLSLSNFTEQPSQHQE